MKDTYFSIFNARVDPTHVVSSKMETNRSLASIRMAKNRELNESSCASRYAVKTVTFPCFLRFPLYCIIHLSHVSPHIYETDVVRPIVELALRACMLLYSHYSMPEFYTTVILRFRPSIHLVPANRNRYSYRHF